MRRGSRYLEGQSLAIISLALLLIFLAIGLAIDGGMLYAQRSLLQNTADSACLAAANRLSLNRGPSEARQAASASIAENLGANPPGSLVYTDISEVYNGDSTTGSDTGLTHGIEINVPSVRVALRSPARSYFLRVGGFSRYTVAARSHCTSNDANGMMPIAVSRWRGYRNPADPQYVASDATSLQNVVIPGPLTDYSLPQSYTSKRQQYEYVVRDLLRPAGDSVITQWPGWGSDPSQPAHGYPGDPLSGNDCCLYASFSPAASPSNPGPPVELIGTDAIANYQPGNADFKGVVVLDLRQVTWPTGVEYYNGLTPNTSPQKFKDFAARYLLNGYPGPWVRPGQELAFHNGVSAGQMVDQFAESHRVGDEIVALVYNGAIYSDPGFSMSFPSASARHQLRPYAPEGEPTIVCTLALDALGYSYDGKGGANVTERVSPDRFSVKIVPDKVSAFRMRAFLAGEPQDWGDLHGSWDGGSSWQPLHINETGGVLSVSRTGRELTFDVTPHTLSSDLGTVCLSEGSPVVIPMRKNGVQTLYLEAEDTTTGRRRGAYAFYDVLNADINDFYAYIPGTLVYEPFEPGSSGEVPLRFELASNGQALPIGSGGVSLAFDWFSPHDLSSPLPGATPLASGSELNGVRASASSSLNGPRVENVLAIQVARSAVVNQEYYLRITATNGNIQHYLWYYIAVREPVINSNAIGDYVYALGYATFRITEIRSNAVLGRATSGLITTPSEIVSGLVPRLLPWEE